MNKWKYTQISNALNNKIHYTITNYYSKYQFIIRRFAVRVWQHYNRWRSERMGNRTQLRTRSTSPSHTVRVRDRVLTDWSPSPRPSLADWSPSPSPAKRDSSQTRFGFRIRVLHHCRTRCGTICKMHGDEDFAAYENANAGYGVTTIETTEISLFLDVVELLHVSNWYRIRQQRMHLVLMLSIFECSILTSW